MRTLIFAVALIVTLPLWLSIFLLRFAWIVGVVGVEFIWNDRLAHQVKQRKVVEL